MASVNPTKRAIPNYYFAFGSNMHLTQMASRCPGSTILAKGVLHGYRWQINERGVANIVHSQANAGEPPAFVEGILFTVSFKDIRTLDRNEGISKQLYDKAWLPIQVEPLAIGALEGRKTAVAAKDLELVGSQPRAESGGQPHGRTGRSGEKLKEVEALVYLSSRYKTDGPIRREYIKRMELAMADASQLGVDESYLQHSLYPHVFVEELRIGLSPQTEPRIIERKPTGAPMNHGERDHGGSRQPEPRIIEVSPRTTSPNATAAPTTCSESSRSLQVSTETV
ncbi:hypothetical protein BDW59DRAFT_161046 [Aspergillus cavernicola]|uniref:gamma-glutamylcyclotransferase n=1 Tax=Aspergillus cavernicola TaxID=176166 RepID=A0ABR4IEN8_9EURO